MPRPTPPFPIAPLGEDERAAFVKAAGLAFGETLSDDAVAHHISAELADPSPALVARDGARIVGTATALDFTMSAPGAPPVACAGVTSVTVMPTHRRRGVLASLMRRQLDDLNAAGTAWAALYASEAAIYGRYGYGIASRCSSFKLDGPWQRFVGDAVVTDVELVDAASAGPRIAPIYERVRAQVPGMMSRTQDQWTLMLEWDPPSDRRGGSARQAAIVADRGFALYRILRGWDDTGPDGKVRIEHCIATDGATWRQLWTFLLNIDLVQHMRAGQQPVDDPLPWWLAERRRLRVSDGVPCYLRLVDVGTALSQRGTNAVDGVVLDVSDPFCPWNTRRWLLEGDGGTLRCEPTEDAAHIALDARELGSLSVGGISPFELERAGLVDEQRDGALASLASLLASHRPPWNPFIF